MRAGVLDPANEVYALRLDFVPIWLSKITITKKMEQETPDLADKLLQYQLKAKDILAAAFLPQYTNQSRDMQYANQDIPLGELASYLKIIDRAAVRQNTPPHKIMEALKMVSEQFGVRLPDDFVNTPTYEQLSLPLEGGAAI